MREMRARRKAGLVVVQIGLRKFFVTAEIAEELLRIAEGADPGVLKPPTGP